MPAFSPFLTMASFSGLLKVRIVLERVKEEQESCIHSVNCDNLQKLKGKFILQGKSEFIGRAVCKPVVKLSHEKYESPRFPPSLEWWDICRGPDRAGELLAAFELLQVGTYSKVCVTVFTS